MRHSFRIACSAALSSYLLLFSLPGTALAVEASTTLLVYNSLDPDGVALSQSYFNLHPGVRVLSLPLGDVPEEVGAQYYLDSIRDPVLNTLQSASWGESIDLIVTTKGLPLRIDAGPVPNPNTSLNWKRYSSLESELTRIDRIDNLAEMGDQFWVWAAAGVSDVLSANPYYLSDVAFDRSDPANEQVRLTARLDGFTLDDTLAALDRASQAYYIDSTYYIVADDDPTAGTDLIPQLVTGVLEPLGQAYLFENTTTPITTAPGPVLGYVGHGVHSAGLDKNYISDQLAFNLADGAVFTTHESFNAVSFEPGGGTSQGSIGAWLEVGGTAGVGNVQEPLSGPFNVANEDQLFEMLLSGQTFAEAAWSSLRQLSYVNTVVGDPLMRLVKVMPGDTNFDGVVDTSDVTVMLSSFTGDVNSDGGMSISNGDTDGDSDVDTADLSLAFQSFTSTLASLANNPNLIYDPTTGNVKIEADGVNMLVFNLQSAAQFSPSADFSGLDADVGFVSAFVDNSANTIGWASELTLASIGFDGSAGSVNMPLADLGNILPTGLDMAGLTALLTNNAWAGSGATSGSFDLVVSQVPEPSSLVLLTLGLLGLICLRRRR